MKYSGELALYTIRLPGLPKQSYKAFFLHGPKQKYNSLILAEQRLSNPTKLIVKAFFGVFNHITILDCNLNKLLKCLLALGLEKDYFSKHMTLNQLFIHNCAIQVSILIPSVWNWELQITALISKRK